MWNRTALAAVLLLCVAGARGDKFDFVALGDTAYRLPEDLPTYDALIDTINAAKPAFSIHVGDIWGASPCTATEYDKMHERFQTFSAALVYTPGDNEWVDCRTPEVINAYVRFMRQEATPEDLALLGPLRTFGAAYTRVGYDDVLSRLADLRRVFFPRAESLGRKPLRLTRQSDVSEFEDMPENAKWTHRGVLFATVHVPGSQNDFFINDEKTAAEAIRRNRAAVAWLESAFADAKAADAKAVVIAMHASLFLTGPGDEEFGQTLRGGGDGPFYWVARAVRDLGSEFGRPVLLVHGDFHQFIVDKPFRVTTGEVTPPRYDNITRLQVYGAPDVRAVRVSVDTDTPWVFGFAPLY